MLSRFNLRERIQDLVSVISELFLRINLWIFEYKFSRNYVIYLSLFIQNITHSLSSKHDRETTDRTIFIETLWLYGRLAVKVFKTLTDRYSCLFWKFLTSEKKNRSSKLPYVD